MHWVYDQNFYWGAGGNSVKMESFQNHPKIGGGERQKLSVGEGV